MALLLVEVLQFCLPHTTAKTGDSEMDLGASIPTIKKQTPTPDKSVTTTEQREGFAQYPWQAMIPTTPVKPPIPYQGDTSQHILRKEVTVIHTKNRSCSNNNNNHLHGLRLSTRQQNHRNMG